MMDLMHSCSCCSRYEFPEEGCYEICPVCNWEDDPVRAEEPDYRGGANVMSLNEVREAFQQGRRVS